VSVDFYVECKINKAICIIRPNHCFVCGVLPINYYNSDRDATFYVFIYYLYIMLTKKRAILKLPTPIYSTLNKCFLFILLYNDNYFYFSYRYYYQCKFKGGQLGRDKIGSNIQVLCDTYPK